MQLVRFSWALCAEVYVVAGVVAVFVGTLVCLDMLEIICLGMKTEKNALTYCVHLATLLRPAKVL